MTPDDLTADISAAEQELLGALATPDAELPLPLVGPKVLEFGAQVICQGKLGKVLVVHRVGDPDSPADVMIMHGMTPDVLLYQPHSPSGWSWPEDVPPPPPTLEEKLRALTDSGVRVPKVGETVLEIRSNVDAFLRTDQPPYQGRRAKVTGIKDVQGGRVTLSLLLFRNLDPPENPHDPDPTFDLGISLDMSGPARSGRAGRGLVLGGVVEPTPPHGR